MKVTDKAGEILQKMKGRSLFQTPEMRDRVLEQFNRSTLDDVGPVGGDQCMVALKEMNDLGQQRKQIVWGSGPNFNRL